MSEPSLPTSPEVVMAITGCRRLNNLAIPYEDIEMLRLAQHRATRQATLAEMEQGLRGAGCVLGARCRLGAGCVLGTMCGYNKADE